MTRSGAWACLAALWTGVAAGDVPRHFPVPGGVAVVPLLTAGDPEPTARFGTRRLAVVAHAGAWVAIVGLAPNLTPGDYIVTLAPETGTADSRRFTVLPNKQAARRAASPATAVTPGTGAASAWREVETLDLAFAAPVEARGRPRYVVRRGAGPHAALEYSVAPGARVMAPSGGIVTALSAATGGAAIDHGRGVVSLLRFAGPVGATSGEAIPKGGTIGSVAAIPGHATASLQWTLLLNGATVNPLLFVGDERPF